VTGVIVGARSAEQAEGVMHATEMRLMPKISPGSGVHRRRNKCIP